MSTVLSGSAKKTMLRAPVSKSRRTIATRPASASRARASSFEMLRRRGRGRRSRRGPSCRTRCRAARRSSCGTVVLIGDRLAKGAHELHQVGARGLLGHQTAKYHSRPSLPLCEPSERPRFSGADARLGRISIAQPDTAETSAFAMPKRASRGAPVGTSARRLYEEGWIVKSGRRCRVRVLARVGGQERRSSLYRLLVGRTRRHWRPAPGAQFQKGRQAARR